MPPKHTPPDVLFWRKVNKNGPVPVHVPAIGQCWEWTAKVSRDGYGAFAVTLPRGDTPKDQKTPQRHVRAHIYSWELANGERMPRGMVIMHACDNPKCVRPEHLKLGTQLENRRDAATKGRTAAKIKNQDVSRVRELAREGFSYDEIAREFNVSHQTVYMIVRGFSRKQVGSNDVAEVGSG